MIEGTGMQAGSTYPAMQPPGERGGGPSFDDVLGKVDSDGDSALSSDELHISEEAFDAADLNKDGVVDQDEFESGGAKIIGEDLMAQGKLPPMGPPPEGMSGIKGPGGSHGASIYESLMEALERDSDSSEDSDMYELLESSLDLVA